MRAIKIGIVLSALAFNVSVDAGQHSAKPLSITTVPVVVPDYFKKLKPISVSEHIDADGQVTRVFRYTFKGSIPDISKKLQSESLANGSWKVVDRKADGEMSLERFPNRPGVKGQAVILIPVRLVLDKTAPLGVRPETPSKSKGWVWISLNETYSKKP